MRSSGLFVIFILALAFLTSQAASARGDRWQRESLAAYEEYDLPFSLNEKDHKTYNFRVLQLLNVQGWGKGKFRGFIIDPANGEKEPFFLTVHESIGTPAVYNDYQFTIFAGTPETVAEVLRQMRVFMIRYMGYMRWDKEQLDKFNMLPLFDEGPQLGLPHPFQGASGLNQEQLKYSASGRIKFYDELKLAYTWALVLNHHFEVERWTQNYCEAALTSIKSDVEDITSLVEIIRD